MIRKRQGAPGFSLMELLVAMAVLAILALIMMGMTEGTMRVSALSHQRMSSDAEARQALDRIGADFDRLLYRRDLPDLIQKEDGNDRIAFFTHAEGYDGNRGISQVSYEVLDDMLKRGALGFTWTNAASGSAETLEFNAAAVGNIPPDNFEVVSKDVFRFEVAFLLTDGAVVSRADRLVSAPGGRTVQALIVGLVALDSKAWQTLTPEQQASLRSAFADSTDGRDHLQQWNGALAGKDFPVPVLNSVRIYQRYFYLKFRPTR